MFEAVEDAEGEEELRSAWRGLRLGLNESLTLDS